MRILLLIFCFISLPCIAQLTEQEEIRIQELEELIQSDVHDTTKINALFEWDYMIYHFDFKQDSILMEKVKSICELNLEQEQSTLLKRRYLLELAKANDYLGIVYATVGKFESASKLHQEAIDIYKSIGMLKGMDGAYINLGTALYDLDKVKDAIEAFDTGIKICDITENKAFKANGLMSLGLIYSDMNESRLALDYFNLALDLSKEMEDTISISVIYLNTGNVYEKLGDIDSSMIYYKASKQLALQSNDDYTLSTIYHNIGEGYLDLGVYDSAHYYLMKGLELRKAWNIESDLVYSYSGLSRWHLAQNNYAKALENGLKGVELAKNGTRQIDYVISMNALYNVYYETGNYKKALDTYVEKVKVQNNIDNAENKKALLYQSVEYEYQSKKLKDSLEFERKQEISNLSHAKELEQEEQQRYSLYTGLGVMLLMFGFALRGYRIKKKDNETISVQKKQIEEAHIELKDSIEYAKRIQNAILPPIKVFKEVLPNSFVMYEPKDIVAGDFYWMEQVGDKVLFAAADCTGHGVPGAMVSVICNNGLNRSVREYGIAEPGQILDKTREIVIREFEKSEEEVKDGMDIALCSLHLPSDYDQQSPNSVVEVQYAGAHNPLWIIRNGINEIEEIKADKQPIGRHSHVSAFTNHNIQLYPGDRIYIFSDGFADQFGGEKGKKFKSANFKKLLLSIQNQSMTKQKQALTKAFHDWKGSYEQLDDICLIGVEI